MAQNNVVLYATSPSGKLVPVAVDSNGIIQTVSA